MERTTSTWTALACILLLTGAACAQNAPIDFEAAGHGAGWTWTVFENGTNPPVQIISNPHATGINTSGTVAQFTALMAGQPWAGCESQHGADIGTFSINESNCTVRVMVYKTVVSNVGVKFARNDGAAAPELLVANTLVNQWEELTFDFSPRIGEPSSTNIDQIILFPDFDLGGRGQDNVILIDNVTFAERIIPVGPEAPAPTPTFAAADVISLFCNAYTNVPVDTWSAVWDQAEVSNVQIEGDDVKLYTSLVFAGIEFTSQTINAAGMTHFHMDIWTADPTAAPAIFKIKLVDFGANGVWDGGGDDVEHELTFDENSTPPLVSGAWINFDIPLADFANLVTRGHLAQLVISGDPNTVYVDNVLFHTGEAGVDDGPGAQPATHQLLGNHPNPFNPLTTIAYTLATPGHATVTVHDLQGRLVRTLLDTEKSAGSHQLTWDGRGNDLSAMSSGLYFVRLAVDGSVVDTRRMTLLK